MGFLSLWFVAQACAIGGLDPATVTSTFDTVWAATVASRLATPPVCTGSSVWVAKKGSVQAYSLVDGSRLYRRKTRGTVNLLRGPGDSVRAFPRFSKGSILVFGDNPPRLVAQQRGERTIIAADCLGAHTAVLYRHGAVGLLTAGGMRPRGSPRGAAPGWSNIEVVETTGDTLIVLSRRSGFPILTGRDSLITIPLEFRGGVVEAGARGDSLFLVGAEGRMALLDSARRMVWERGLPSGLQSAPVMQDEWVWLALRNRTLIRVNIHNGRIRGEWVLTGPLACPLAAYGDGVAWGTLEGRVWVVRSGRASPEVAALLTRPAVGLGSRGDDLVISQDDGRLLCLRPRAKSRGLDG
ncbi:MAG: PQQ-binding-like beta-propeller repeat protein [Candidatus Eisenbacteria bacterium]|jgi:outer membrane protein assembly factor BamB|nr:PQQ-binding-like beta-propeller repeat protein [Candidatus Eisenbacteria bacterium]